MNNFTKVNTLFDQLIFFQQHVINVATSKAYVLLYKKNDAYNYEWTIQNNALEYPLQIGMMTHTINQYYPLSDGKRLKRWYYEQFPYIYESGYINENYNKSLIDVIMNWPITLVTPDKRFDKTINTLPYLTYNAEEVQINE